MRSMNYASSTSSAGKGKVPSFKELFLINKSTYYALLQKLTPLEKSDIERMNRQTLLPEDDDVPKPPVSVTSSNMYAANPPQTAAAAIMAGNGGGSNSSGVMGASVQGSAVATAEAGVGVPLETNSSDDVFEPEDQQQEKESVDTGGDDDDSEVNPVTATAENDANLTLQHQDEAEISETTEPPATAGATETVDATTNQALDETPTTLSVQPQQAPPSVPTQGLLPFSEHKKGKKTGHHHMPHIVTLKNNPQTLVTQIHPPPPPPSDNNGVAMTASQPLHLPEATTKFTKSSNRVTSSQPTATLIKSTKSSDKTSTNAATPSTSAQLKISKSQHKKPKHVCKECGAEFRAEWTLFKHVTSAHDDSDYAKELLLAHDRTLQARRSSQRLKNQATAMASSAASTTTTPRQRGQSKQDAPKDTLSSELPSSLATTLATSKSANVLASPTEASGTNLTTKQRRAKAAKPSVLPYSKTKTPAQRKAAGKSKDILTRKTTSEVNNMEETPPDLVRSATAAGRKRSAKVANSTNALSTLTEDASKKAVRASSKSAKRSRSMFSNKRFKNRRYDDEESDDEYEAWT